MRSLLVESPDDHPRADRTTTRKWAVFAGAWSLCILAGVAWLKGTVPERNSPLLAALSASEPVHIVAHCLLYGTLAVLCSRVVRRPMLAVLLTVLLGAAQEKLQVLFARRAMAGPELFDLAVDATAAMLAAFAYAWWRRE